MNDSNQFRAFNPIGPTVAFTANTTAPTAVQVKAVGAPPNNQYRVYNSTAVTVFISADSDATTALADCVVPTGSGSNSKLSYPLPSGAVEVFSFGPDWFFTGITSSGSGSVYVTPGAGL